MNVFANDADDAAAVAKFEAIEALLAACNAPVAATAEELDAEEALVFALDADDAACVALIPAADAKLEANVALLAALNALLAASNEYDCAEAAEKRALLE